MDERCGELFEEATRVNQTLIDFEFGFNNFHLEHVSLNFLGDRELIFILLYRLERFKIT